MTDIKARILQTAQSLFADYGYQNVTMRRIAGELGISVGNLTYHYHKKSDIANAILAAELENISESAEPGLAELDGLLRRMVLSLFEHERVFGDPLLLRTLTDPETAVLSRERMAQLHRQLSASLAQQQRAGLLSAELTPLQLEDMTSLLMAAHAGWQESHLGQGGEAASVAAIMRAQWTVLRPMLTEKGREELEKINI